MENLANKLQSNRRIEVKPKKPTWNQITKAANKLAKKRTSPTSILSKVENKLSDNITFFDKNIHWRNKAQFGSYLCMVVSIIGGSLGVYSFIHPNNPMSWLIASVMALLIIVNEYGFRYFTDKYGDELFLFKVKINSHLPKFVIFSLVSVFITSGGYYKWNIENHAPDPSLVAIKAEIKEKKLALITEQKAYTNLVASSTVKTGKDKGRIQYKMEGSVNAAKENLESLKNTIAQLENQTRGKKVLDPIFQENVIKESIQGALGLMFFQLVYIGFMLYMSYFDNRHYSETYPSKYLSYVASRNNENINF